MTLPRLSRLALLEVDRAVAELQERAAAPEIVAVGWDGRSRPMYRYRDDMPLPDHARRIVAPEHRPR